VLALVVVWGLRSRASELGRLRTAVLPSDLLVAIAALVAIVGISREGARHGAWVPWLSAAVATLAFGAAAWVGRWRTAAAGSRAAAALAAQFCLGTALITPLVLVPVWASTLLGRPAQAAALILLRLTLAIPPSVLLGSIAAPYFGRRIVAVGGFGLAALGMLLMST
jgi:hypothetical protein